MQYRLNLPADYDIDIIRQRIASAGPLFDHTPGLGLKAFMLREKGVDGSPLHQYAPFYLWADSAAAATFLWDGGGFARVVASFGRPVVQTWIGGGYHRAAAFTQPITHAVRRVAPIPADADPAETATVVGAAVRDRLAEPGLHSIAWAVDPRTWESMTFALHAGRPDPSDGELYQVPHVSAPHEPALLGPGTTPGQPTGRGAGGTHPA
ncbi:DUF4865 family protein [Catenuloplanes nepalensis]|nr:DUF4865 family protein [Catenuloplanes nepalensis]